MQKFPTSTMVSIRGCLIFRGRDLYFLCLSHLRAPGTRGLHGALWPGRTGAVLTVLAVLAAPWVRWDLVVSCMEHHGTSGENDIKMTQDDSKFDSNQTSD